MSHGVPQPSDDLGCYLTKSTVKVNLDDLPIKRKGPKVIFKRTALVENRGFFAKKVQSESAEKAVCESRKGRNAIIVSSRDPLASHGPSRHDLILELRHPG